jgi:glycosyltransferase involved in cell wall biosynthesis
VRVWLIDIGDPLPLFHPEDRRFRAGNIAEHLMEAGHHVTWWGSTFDHARKRHEAKGDLCAEVSPRLTYRAMRATSYARNVSFERVVNHWLIGRKFRRYARSEVKPDVIVCSFPTLDLAFEAARYGESNGVPVLLDIRDLWPQVMLDVVPRGLAGVGKIALAPYFWMASQACRRATGLMGITPGFVEWGAACAGRPLTLLDRHFPLANERWSPTQEELARSRRNWHSRGLGEADFILCLAGSLGTRRLLDLDTVVVAARELRERRPNCKFVLCGTGDSLEYYRVLARDCENVTLPGWVDRSDIWALLHMASVGLVPYPSTYSGVRSYPIKVIEYLSAALPILSSLDGSLAALLLRSGCGITYPNRDSKGLTRAVLDLTADSPRLEDMRRHARQLYETEFHPDKVYGAMVRHVEYVAAAFRGRPGC